MASLGVIFAIFSTLLPALAVIVIPSSEAVPKPYQRGTPVSSIRDLLFLSYPNLRRNASKTEILDSSQVRLNATHGIYPSEDGFFRGVMDAWAQHQHLVLRPDDVWFTVLVQMNFYMTKHADNKEVRDLFVNHQGKQPIYVQGSSLGDAMSKFPAEIQKRVKTKWLQEWIFPNFTTTEPAHDHLIAGVLMMGMMKAYFEYHASVPCGIPSITLLGEKADWEKLLAKLERLKDFGAEPTSYRAQLQPVLSRFVKTFDNPKDPEIREFWSNIVTVETIPGGCTGPRYNIDGWMTGFQFWDARGEKLRDYWTKGKPFVLDGITYPVRSADGLPAGYATVPIKIQLPSYIKEIDCDLLAGMVGKRVHSGAPKGYFAATQELSSKLPNNVEESQHAVLHPYSAWFLYKQTDGVSSYPVPNRIRAEYLNFGQCLAQGS
jgi:hypothetical protein